MTKTKENGNKYYRQQLIFRSVNSTSHENPLEQNLRYLCRYQIENNVNSVYFEFISTGSKGSIVKVIKYTKINDDPIVYNLGFGDKNLTYETIDDRAVTNSGYTDRVLATVAFTIYTFYKEYPDANVYLSGSSTSRTRLYQINISKYLNEIVSEFEVFGELEDNIERFKKGVNYLGFYVVRHK